MAIPYVFTDDATARLRAVEELLDDGTLRILDKLGVAPGWRCLEVGAGGGSIAHWLATARGASVVATDLDIRHIEPHPSIELRQHDVVADPLEDAAFDLVHARLLLEHLPQRTEVLRKFARALRPGGWLLVESVDYVSAIAVGEHGARAHEHTQQVRLDLFNQSGVDHTLGRYLPARLRDQGLVNVENEGRVWVMHAGSPAARWFHLSLAHLGPRLIATGQVSDAQLQQALRNFEDPRWSAYSPIIMAAWGQKPVAR